MPSVDRPIERQESPTLGYERPGGGSSEARSPTPEPGGLIDGNYRVIEKLGEGGMGVVVLARDERLQRMVAVKLVRPELLQHAEARQRFLVEARAMARVHHPNVVQIHSYGEVGGTPYFVMEYVPGDNLDRWMRRRGAPPLPLDQVISVLDQVCRGVEAIHQAGSSHRDLKPGNLLVGPAFRIVITDLGMAELLGQSRREGSVTISGTPEYLAPELVLHTPVGAGLMPRADIYSLGVIAYEMLTGHLPFDARDPRTVIRAHVYQTALEPTKVNPDLPPAFDAVIMHALAKNPAERIATAESFRLALIAARETHGPSFRALRLLVADDDDGYRTLITRLLAKTFPGSVVESVPDGATALAAIERQPPALAVIDLDMPGLNGVELTASIRSLRGGDRIAILVATGVGGGADWQLLQRLGADGFLVKPFDPAQLGSLARALVGMRHEHVAAE